MADRYVIDASVAAKWFLEDELDTDVAEAILKAFLADDLELHAPQVFRHEVCGLLTKACGTRDRATKAHRLSKLIVGQSIRELFRCRSRSATSMSKGC